MKIFLIKCFIITACIYFILINFIPKNYYLDKEHRFDVISGVSERYNTYTGNWCKY